MMISYLVPLPMRDQGLLAGPVYGDLRDLVTQKVLVSVEPDDTLLIAYTRMRAHGVSQLPVLDKGELVGLLDEWDLLQAVTPNKANFAHLVRGVMTTTLETCDASADVSALLPLFERNLVPIITHNGKFEGLITKIDYLNYLRRRNG